MAKKHKNHIGGFDAPRNSLELSAESFQSRYTVREYQPYSHVVRQNMPKSSSFSTNPSMKKLISDEISRGSNHKQRGPSIVARLMGMDVFPSDTESIIEHKDNSPGIGGLPKQNRENISNGYAHKKSYGDRYLCSSDKHMYTHSLNNGEKMGKPRHRLHPQEKELQQFKKDFEAWQASRFLECAKVAELENIPDQWLAQLDQNNHQTKEKMAAYENARKAAREKAESLTRHLLKPRTPSRGDEHYHSYKKSSFSPKHKNPYAFRTKSMDREFEELSMMDFDKRSDRSSTPARIVILKPGPESFSSNDESWASSSGSVDDKDCIEDLLEEVKERLRSELQGKTFKRGSMIRGGGIETPFKERPIHPNQRARDLRMQVRENITGDLARKLLRSESTRSHRSEIYPNSDSPEYNRQDAYAKQLLSEQLRGVKNGESHQDIPNMITCSSRGIAFDDTRGRLEQVRNILNAKNDWNHWDDSNNGDYYPEARSFRHEFSEEETLEEGMSPRNLVRSLSAPVPGTSFGKLLLEDRHILTGAHVRRKHEALESAGLDGKDRKKERFKLRKKVSDIRYNFTLKGKLFSRKFHSFDLSQANEYDLMKDINSGPTVLMNFTDRNENYTEVPPSPASVCSSPPEELQKPADHPSPTSTSGITSVEDHSVSNVLREISSNLTELRRDLDQLDLEDSITEEPLEAEVENMEDESEAYIRDLLIASGLYYDPSEEIIDDLVFAKVEELYVKPNEQDEESPFPHKVLFDLLNEALTIVLNPPKTQSRFRRNVNITATPLPPPLGKTLLQQVWEIIRRHIYPSPDNTFPSLEDMVSHDLDFGPWVDLIDEELKGVGREMEERITSELIEEIVKDIIDGELGTRVSNAASYC